MNPEIFRIGSFAVRWYGLLFVSGFVIGYWMFARFFKREKVNEALLDPLLYTLLIGTLVGARLGHCIFYQPDYYFGSWKGFLEIFAVWHGGLASHGGGADAAPVHVAVRGQVREEEPHRFPVDS